ncbi:programmed cell death protein 7 [Armigeres subalbatus]|uniref:programmed cell death protein 7 n=1 Tax=Armigeres subalbatus TaxID=124917 RepID=UPI002ED68C4A
MSALPFFDPTRPPPTIELLCNQNIAQEYNGTKVQPSNAHQNNLAPASITSLRTELVDLIEKVEKLKTNKEWLEKETESQSDNEWKINFEQAKLLKQNIDDTLLNLMDSDRLKLVQKKLHLRRKKRDWIMRRKSRMKQEKDKAIQNRKKLDDQIDQWQKEQRKQLDKEKQAQQELDFASKFLADVHRRKAACKRYLAKFDKMKNRNKLDKDLQTEIDDLTRTWTTNLCDCIKEEKRLKDVLARKSAANYQRRVENEWNKTLFGDAIPKKFEHPLLGADRDREVLIGVRHEWDVCLVDHHDEEGSSIPLGWVLPPENPTSDWSKYQMMELI